MNQTNDAFIKHTFSHIFSLLRTLFAVFLHID